MSAEAVGWVYRYSPFKGSTFIVHLAIADSVNDQHGNEFWMLETMLAKKVRASRRSTTRALSELLRDGWLNRLEGAVKMGHPARFSFVFKPAAVVYETRATTSRVPTTREPLRTNTRATTTQHASHSDSQNPIDPKMNPKHLCDPGFAAFWTAYPKKVGKGRAEKSWHAALKIATTEDIMLGLKRALPIFAKMDPQFVPHPSTWLNDRRWEDEPAAVANASEPEDDCDVCRLSFVGVCFQDKCPYMKAAADA